MDRLWNALEELSEDWKWGKGSRANCALKAMGFTYEYDSGFVGVDFYEARADPEVQVLASVIGEHYPDRVNEQLFPDSVVWLFNDHADTTVDEVRMVLEKAAIRYDEAVF